MCFRIFSVFQISPALIAISINQANGLCALECVLIFVGWRDYQIMMYTYRVAKIMLTHRVASAIRTVAEITKDNSSGTVTITGVY